VSEGVERARLAQRLDRLLVAGDGVDLAQEVAEVGEAALASRVRTIEATTLVPTLRIADRPKRMSVPRGVKSLSESLTSGGSTLMPMRRHSARYSALLSLSSLTDVSSAAMYSAG
jgi:hypothetical protein